MPPGVKSLTPWALFAVSFALAFGLALGFDLEAFCLVTFFRPFRYVLLPPSSESEPDGCHVSDPLDVSSSVANPASFLDRLATLFRFRAAEAA